MKVLDLQCAQGHSFEGWFASEDDFRRQMEGGLLTCPLCGQTQITRLPSAPRLNLHGAGGQHNRDQAPAEIARESESPSQATAPVAAVPDGLPAAVQTAWLRAVRHVLTHTENVGERFAEEARRMHHGEAPERGIRGKASPAETEALLAEGITVLPLPIPEGMDGPLQ
jgi:hypothetical protein